MAVFGGVQYGGELCSRKVVDEPYHNGHVPDQYTTSEWLESVPAPSVPVVYASHHGQTNTQCHHAPSTPLGGLRVPPTWP
jgi:hypothetical protein